MSYILSGKYVFNYKAAAFSIPDFEAPQKEFVSKDNVITLNLSSFMWDGMSMWREGKNTVRKDDVGTFLPESWKASLLHDICYTYVISSLNFPISRKICDKIIKSELEKIWGLSEAYLIYKGLRIFGGLWLHMGNKSALPEKEYIKQGEITKVYNKKPKQNEHEMHYYTWIEYRKEMKPIRLTKKQLHEAIVRAENNIEDIPLLNF